MKDFDIHALDLLEPGSDAADAAFDGYRRRLVVLFGASPECQAFTPQHGPAGGWAGLLLDFGFNHLGVPLPQMTVSSLDEIISDYFPRKVSLQTPDEAEDIVPELIAFWQFLGREFALDIAVEAVRYLREMEPSMVEMMNDPSRFGMAKSFFMSGEGAGFDMTDPEQMDRFVAEYNARIAADSGDASEPPVRRSSSAGGNQGSTHTTARKLRKRISKINKKKKH